MAALFQQSREAIMVCDSGLRILLVNPAFEKITGYCETEAVGRTPRVLHSGCQDHAFYVRMWEEVNTHGHWRGEVRNRRKSGEIYSQWLNINAIGGEPEGSAYYVGTYYDGTQHEKAQLRTRYMAEHDALTELPNEALLTQRWPELTTVARQTKEIIAVLFIDLDRFNRVNESLGRRAGDGVLKTVARRLMAGIRQIDLAARLAGDEFVIVLPQLRHAGEAADIAEQLLSSIRSPITVTGQELVISATIGIAIFPGDGTQIQQLICNAATAVHDSKRERRNAFHFYSREMSERATEQLHFETALRLAPERHELVLHYQPQIDLTSGAIVGCEALLRWNRPGVGLVPPGEFIPAAEECGLMPTLGRWAMGEALRQVKEWSDQGVSVGVVAVNVSATELTQPDFVAYVKGEIRRHGVEADQLEIEITENASLHQAESVTQRVRELHALGVRLSLDDFGTGYSSLGYLRRYPFDKIKIDHSFVREITTSSYAIQLVRAIIALASNFAMTVIAEGVETPEQLTALRAERCDEIQGHLAGKAVAPAEFVERLLNWQPGPFRANTKSGPATR